jgi:hypothetical protein
MKDFTEFTRGGERERRDSISKTNPTKEQNRPLLQIPTKSTRNGRPKERHSQPRRPLRKRFHRENANGAAISVNLRKNSFDCAVRTESIGSATLGSEIYRAVAFIPFSPKLISDSAVVRREKWRFLKVKNAAEEILQERGAPTSKASVGPLRSARDITNKQCHFSDVMWSASLWSEATKQMCHYRAAQASSDDILQTIKSLASAKWHQRLNGHMQLHLHTNPFKGTTLV